MNQSYWILTSKGKRYPKLEENISADCVIIGGGIAGLTTAYLLLKKKVNVVIVEADSIGYGASGRNTGKVNLQHGIVYSKIANSYNELVAKGYYAANKKALDLMKSIIHENEIQCEFMKQPSYLFTQEDSHIKDIKEEYIVCKNIGIECEYMESIPLPIDVKAALYFAEGAEFHPKKYVDGLAECITKMGGIIYENTPIENIEDIDNCKVVSSDGYSIRSKKLVICSHFPCYDGMGFYFSKMRPDRTYIVAAEYDSLYPGGTYINVEDPKRSIRYYKGTDEKLLLIAGDNHKVGHKTKEDHYGNLKEYGRKVFGVQNFKYQWSTQDYITPDKIPYIGYLNKSNQNIYVATGFSKWGMTNGTVAGMIISDLIVDKVSHFKDIFTSDRSNVYFTKDFVKENLDVAGRWIAGKLEFGNDKMPGVGEAKLVTIDKKRYGAYRDEEGELYIVDITCPHMGCELNWNKSEKTWDCPCHGSRFNYNGDIYNGPATTALNKKGPMKNKINPKLT